MENLFLSQFIRNPSYEGKSNNVKIEYENYVSVNNAITYKF